MSVHKSYGFENVFNNDKPEKLAKADKRLEKGFLHRKEVTALFDRMNGSEGLSVDRDEAGHYIWKQRQGEAETVIDTDSKSSTTPFWMRRIAHWINIRCDQEYADAFENKKNAVLEAVATMKSNQAAQIAQEAKDAATLAAQQEKAALIQGKKDAKGALQTELEALLAEKTPIDEHISKLGNDKDTATINKTNAEGTLALLQKFHNGIAANWLGTLALNDEEKADLATLVKDLKKTEDQLKDAATRTHEIGRLTALIQKETATIADKNLLINGHTPLQEQLAGQIQQKQAAINALNTEIITLETGSPPVEEPSLEEVDAQPTQLEKLLLGANATIDLQKFKDAQQFEQNPLFNNKLRFTSVQQRDEFYTKTLCPMLYMGASILTVDKPSADALYQKWKDKLETTVQAWTTSGSAAHEIDQLIPPDAAAILNYLQTTFSLISFLGNSGIKSVEFFEHLKGLSIPKTMQMRLNLPEKQTLAVLNHYLEDQDNTDLSPLFAENSEFRNWPKDCQFFLAISLYKLNNSLDEVEKNPESRQELIDTLKESLKFELPAGISTLFSICGSEWLFNTGISNVESLLPEVPLEPARLAEFKKGCQEAKPPIPLDGAKFQAATQFANTPERKAYDTAYRSYASMIHLDLARAFAAKHTTDTSKLGTGGKEINLQAVVVNIRDLYECQRKSAQKTIEYLEELNKPKNPAARKRKKEAAEKEQTALLLQSLKLTQALSALPLNNANFKGILHKVDEEVLPRISAANAALDLETQPFLQWMQENVLASFQIEGAV